VAALVREKTHYFSARKGISSDSILDDYPFSRSLHVAGKKVLTTNS